jgi:WD40 repeat protein
MRLAGDGDGLRRAAAAGDRQAARAYARWLADQGRVEELRALVDTGDRAARWGFADLLVRRGQVDLLDTLARPAWLPGRLAAMPPPTGHLAPPSLTRKASTSALAATTATTAAGPTRRAESSVAMLDSTPFGIAAGPDGLLAVSDGRYVTVYHGETRAARRLDGGYAAAFSPDGRLLACTGAVVRIWDLTTGTPAGRVDRASAAVAFSPDGTLLAGAALWSVDTGEELIRDLGGPLAVAFREDGCSLVAFTFERATVVDVSGRRVAKRRPTGREWAVPDPRGTRFATGGPHWVHVWNVETRERVAAFATEGPATAIALASNGLLATAHRSAGVRVWEPATGDLVRTVDIAAVSLTFTPDSARLVTAGAELRTWSV